MHSQTLSAKADDVVLVHDAVRPFITAEIIGNVIQAAEKHQAAIAGWPAVDTVKQARTDCRRRKSSKRPFHEPALSWRKPHKVFGMTS